MSHKRSWFWGIHADPPKWFRTLLGVLPFVLLLGVYTTISDQRTEINPSQKLLPGISKMVFAVKRMALTPDRRTCN